MGRRRLQPHDGHVHHVGGDAGRPARPPPRVHRAAWRCSPAASALCGLAPTLLVLNIGRGLQGVGAATVNVASLALVSAAFPDPKAKARAIGIWTGIASVGLAIGPTRRWLPHRDARLAEHLLRQRRHRRGRHLAGAGLRGRVARPHAPRPRPPRPGPVHRRRRRTHLRPHRGTALGLALAHHPRPAHRLGGAGRRLRRGRAARPRPDDGCAGVPRPRLHRGHPHALRRAVRDLRPAADHHAVLPERGGLQPRAGRRPDARLHRAHDHPGAHLGRPGRHARVAADPPWSA